MIQQFTTKRDVIRAFANAMNLVQPEVESHHERVAFLAYRLAEAAGMSEQHKHLAYLGGLTHDIGGFMIQGKVTLAEIERNARMLSAAGASLMRLLPVSLPIGEIVSASQTPWECIKRLPSHLKAPQQIGQIVHLADTVSLMFKEETYVLNQIPDIQRCAHDLGENEFSPAVLAAFDKLCGQESVWMDMLYQPQVYLSLVDDGRWFSLDEMVKLTEFMSKIIDFRSPFTAMHSAGVAATAVSLAQLSGMSEDECKMMRIAGYLHDIGKLRIPNEILDKPGKLTDSEFNIMKEHAYYTHLLLKDVKGFEQVCAWAAFHHEKLTGSGYPFHLSREDIPFGSRIMTVADIFSAITEDRPYRRGMEREKVIRILREDVARDQISQSITELLIENYALIDERRAVESAAASKKYQESLAAQNEQPAADKE